MMMLLLLLPAVLCSLFNIQQRQCYYMKRKDALKTNCSVSSFFFFFFSMAHSSIALFAFTLTLQEQDVQANIQRQSTHGHVGSSHILLSLSLSSSFCLLSPT
ncbi:MAG: hypothetical protein J3R72DRAFT_437263 [Linnemannia gamsii]|nr:MAG: hypothetical protein J3R72DRAFT_437263 [Linnemannia gamsii]